MNVNDFDKYNFDDLFNIPDPFNEKICNIILDENNIRSNKKVCNIMSDENNKIISIATNKTTSHTSNKDVIVSDMFSMVCFNYANKNINDITKSWDEWEMYNTLIAPRYVYTFLPNRKHRSKAKIESKALLTLSNKNILNKFVNKCHKKYLQIRPNCYYMRFNAMFWIKIVLYGIVESIDKPHFNITHGCCVKESKFIELLCNLIIIELSGKHFIAYCKTMLNQPYC